MTKLERGFMVEILLLWIFLIVDPPLLVWHATGSVTLRGVYALGAMAG